MLVIVYYLIKIVYYKPINIIINALSLIKKFINIVIQYYNLLKLIINDKSLFFSFKFWFLLYYFLNIK